jgi:hypothetical protein
VQSKTRNKIHQKQGIKYIKNAEWILTMRKGEYNINNTGG